VLQLNEWLLSAQYVLSIRGQTKRSPLLPNKVPHTPSQKVRADIFELNSNSYLVVVDYYSKYPELCLLKDKTAGSVITAMKSVYARHGIPDKVTADNMPFSFSSKGMVI